MTTRRTALLSLALTPTLAVVAHAHGPSRRRVTETVNIARSPDQVWAIAGNYDAIARWHPLVASSPSSKGNEVGAVRKLTLRAPGDPVLEEELVRYEAPAHLYQYRIDRPDPKVLPVNNYVAWFELKPGTEGGTLVEWRAAFYRGFMNNDPPPELDDDAAIAAVTAVFRAGLNNLKKMAEAA